MARQPRIQAPGILQHLLARGIEGRSIFQDENDCQSFISRMGKNLKACLVQCFAWCLMPNHLHLLVRPGDISISTMMARLLTGYAIGYNKKYDRRGYLFQNRFKSILCADEKYFLELVRYIHLNPLRAGIVGSLDALAAYPWSGHRTLLGYDEHHWYDATPVLEMFHDNEIHARQAYLDFITIGSDNESHPLMDNTQHNASIETIQRGKTDTHQQINKTCSQKDRDQETLSWRGGGTQMNRVQRRASLHSLARRVARSFGITSAQLKARTRNPLVVRARSKYAYLAVHKHGYQKVEVARYLGQSIPAVEKNIQRTAKYSPEMIE